MLYYRYRKKERKYYEKDESGIRNKKKEMDQRLK